jgi:hypothetical protein
MQVGPFNVIKDGIVFAPSNPRVDTFEKLWQCGQVLQGDPDDGHYIILYRLQNGRRGWYLG